MTTQTCKLCKVEKTLSEFHKHTTSKSGHRSRCRDCESTSTMKSCQICQKDFKGGKLRKNCGECIINYKKTILYKGVDPTKKLPRSKAECKLATEEALYMKNMEIIEGEYKNNTSLLTIRCPNGHEWEQQARCIEKYARCDICWQYQNDLFNKISLLKVY